MDILEAIVERRKYPVLPRNDEAESEYAQEVLRRSHDRALLVFPVLVFRHMEYRSEVRDSILDGWHIAGIFDASTILGPETRVDFSLLYVQRTPPGKIIFGLFTGHTFDFCSTRRQDEDLGALPPFSEAYRMYLTGVGQFIETGSMPPAQNEYRFHEVAPDQFDQSQLSTRFYDPDLADAEEKIRRETWVPLEQVAQILVPRPTSEPAKLLGGRVFQYPFPSDLPLSEQGTNVSLQRGDVLVSSLQMTRAFLITVEPPANVRPARNTFVIRTQSDKVSPYYLLLYLKSEVARKYAARRAKGGIPLRIDLRGLQDLPVIVPSLPTLQLSEKVFERLFLHSDGASVAEINEFLFSRHDLPSAAIQREMLLGAIADLRTAKRKILSKLLSSDFGELDNCLHVGAYKSCLILCGSIMEAILLDWLSEVRQEDYFDAEGYISLQDLIWGLRDELGDAWRKADAIRQRRNLVHPRKLVTSPAKIDEEVCRAVLRDLHDILGKRGLSHVN